jgi:Tol biopolymer transport system component
MRSLRLLLALAAVVLAACPYTDPPFIECIDDTSCGLHDGGHCLANAATGHSFCAYPDPACVGGLRWSDYDVEDSISGTCVAAAPCLARFAFEAGDDVWVANADGTGLRNVSVSTFVDVAPQWSPTADRIAFESSRAGTRDIFTVKADGTDQVNLTAGNAALDQRPVWSPGGTSLAFLRDTKLWVMDAAGSNARQLAALDVFDSGGVSWSPDGTRIAFVSGDDIYTITIAGGQPVNLTNSAGIDALPAWSPDGTKIAYTVQSGPGDDIWMMNADGAAKVNLTMTPQALEGGASWSPDGTQIVFTSDRDALGGEVYRIAIAAPGAHQRMTTTADGEAAPAWSPAGDQIAYVSVGTASTTVVIVDPSGAGPVPLTLSNAAMVQPSWAPACQ